MSNLGSTIARQKAWARQKFGSDVVAGGKTLRMKTRSLEKREHDFIPDGLRNAAAADLRVFEATPTDFPQMPAVGSILSWHNVSYTLLLAVPGDNEVDGTVVTLNLFVYRTPASDADTAASANETNPSQRKEYWPSPQT